MARNKRQYGTGRLVKRGNSWLIRWYETEMMQDGSTRRVQRNETLGEISRKEASDILSQRVATSTNKPVLRARSTFAEIASQWEATIVPNYKFSTAKIHLNVLNKHLLPRFGERDVSKITRQEIQAYIAYLTKQGYAPKSVDQYHDVLSAVLRTAVEWGYIADNPTRGVKLPVLKTVRPKFALTHDQASRLLIELPDLARTMVGLDILTGLRRGELFALRWKHIDWHARVLKIEDAVYEGTFGSPKTEAGNRTIPLCDAALDLLSEWRVKTPWMGEQDLIFCTRFGKPICPNNTLRRSIFPVCDKIGLPRVTWLTFRRTYSSWAHDSGVAAKVIARLMGHENIDVTLNIYTQVMDSSLRSAAEKVGAFLKLSTIEHKKEGEGPLIH